jgi:hypothetical protein
MSGIAKTGPAKWTRRFLARAALVLIMPAFLRASPQQIQIEYQQSRKFNAILIVVQVNDKNAVLIVDTGSDRTIISPHLLVNEPLRGKFHVSFLAARRDTPAGWGRANLQLSNQAWKGLLVVVQDQNELRQAFGQPIDGILGQDILGQFRRVIIDSEHHILTLQQ